VSPRLNIPIHLRNVSIADYNFPHPSFDIYGKFANTTVLTTYSGYVVSLRINDTTAFLEYLNTLNLSNIYLSIDSRQISINSLILRLEIMNTKSIESIVDLSITTDINFDGSDNASCATIIGGHGFTVYSALNALTFITGGYPFVTDVSTFWFGSYDNRTEKEWTQVIENSFSGGDSALSFWWQNIIVPAGETVRKSVIVRFGSFETAHVVLMIEEKKTRSVSVDGQLLITGVVNVIGSPAKDGISLFLVVDDAVEPGIQLPDSVMINVRFSVEFVLRQYGIGIGNHRFVFWTVDADGDISESQIIDVKVEKELEQESPDATEPTEEKGDRTMVAILGAIGGSGLIGALFVALLCYGRKRDRDNAELESDIASATEGIEGEMVDELL
jgi:hypothetical protein